MIGACFEGAFGLLAIMFGFDVGVESWVGEISFAATTEIIASFLIFAGSPGGGSVGVWAGDAVGPVLVVLVGIDFFLHIIILMHDI